MVVGREWRVLLVPTSDLSFSRSLHAAHGGRSTAGCSAAAGRGAGTTACRRAGAPRAPIRASAEHVVLLRFSTGLLPVRRRMPQRLAHGAGVPAARLNAFEAAECATVLRLCPR